MSTTIQEKILSQDSFNMKFADAAFSASGALSPGWAEPTFEDFFTRVTDEPVLLEQSRVIQMRSLQHDIDDLGIELDFDAQRNASTGASTGLTSRETAPIMKRKQLLAQPLQAKTIIPLNFIDENIEGEDFLSKWIGLLGNEMGPAMERYGIYADSSVSTQTGEGTGFTMTNGILAQAKAIAGDNTNEAAGFAPLTYSNNALEGLLNAAEMYIEQDGNMKNANIIVPPAMYSKVVRDIATRESDFGDTLLKDGKIPMIMGMEVKQDNVLRNTRHGWDSMKFDSTTGLPKGNCTLVDKLRYAFIGEPSNLVFGMMRDMDVLNQFDIDEIGYKVVGLAKADAKIHYDQDTIVVPYTKNAKSNS